MALIFFLLRPTVVSAATPSLEGAINKAGHQRMLAQRVSKGFLMVALGIQARQGRAIMHESIVIADMELQSLKGIKANEDARTSLRRLERYWEALKAAVGGSTGREQGQIVYDASEAVQSEAHRLTLIYEKLAGAPADRLVNIAGRQRMLSQRIAKYYLFHVWGVNTAAADMELRMAIAEFSSGIRQLQSENVTSPEIKATLNRLSAEWDQYKDLLSATDSAGAPPVVFASETVLVSCEALVSLFEQEAANRRNRPRMREMPGSERVQGPH